MTAKEKKTRILGLAFLIQFVTSFSAGAILLPMATGVQGFGVPEDIGQATANIAKNSGLVQTNILLELVTAAGVIFLGATLYSTLRKQHEGLALTGFGLYVLEGALIAVTKLMLFALLIFSRQVNAGGSPAAFEPLAGLLYEVMACSSTMLSFAFCLGGTIFYALLFKARTVARPLSLWGLVSVQGVFAGVVLALFGVRVPIFFYVFYVPFELVIAVWILVRGVRKEA